MTIANRHRLILLAIASLYVAMSIVGITWGLPSRGIDPYLFGGDEPWSGEKIYRLAHADEKLSDEAIRTRGADVDVDPVREARGRHRTDAPESSQATEQTRSQHDARPNRPDASSIPHEHTASDYQNTARNNVERPIPLTATDEDVARIYLRYRLYTYQPDEMITMMALAGMKPGGLRFDPRLYQYGGLWIYPVGALIKLCGAVGLIDVRSDLVFYLDNPHEFGKFYIVARAYSAAWGLLGLFVVFGITRRLLAPIPCGSRHTSGPGWHGHACSPVQDEQASHVYSASGGLAEPQSASLATGPRTNEARATRAALLAALLFTLMPVVVCMAHEGKPHLPGAVLMLLAVYFAMRAIERAVNFSPRGQAGRSTPETHRPPEFPQHTGPRGAERAAWHALKPTVRHPLDWWMMCVCCGAAVGMVLSSVPILLLIPLSAWLRQRRSERQGAASPPEPPSAHGSATHTPNGEPQPEPRALAFEESRNHVTHERGHPPDLKVGARWLAATALGLLIALFVYLVSNPYVFINALTNRAVLASNFGNSLGMYEIDRLGAGFLPVLALTVEGATLPMVALGFIALAIAIIRRHRATIPLVVAASVFFLQLVLIGAGKPAEYGRFGVFPNTALAIGAAILLTTRWTKMRINGVPGTFAVIWCATFGGAYLRNFWIDTTNQASRITARRTSPFGPNVGSKLDPWTTHPMQVLVPADPAPYGCPPLPFNKLSVARVEPLTLSEHAADSGGKVAVYVRPVDQPTTIGSRVSGWSTPISWANKPIKVTTGSP